MARESKRWFGAGSSGHADPYADTADDSAPVDIAAVRRDDALIDAIAGDGPVATDSADEYQVATLLANWRAEITAPPLPAAPDMEAIAAAVDQEIAARNTRASSGHKLRLVRPIAGAAAAIALIVGAMTAVSYNAQPGDPLWKVKEVVFSDQADSTMANSDTTSDLQRAEQLIASGDIAQAKVFLDRASSRVGDVKADSDRENLQAWWQRLNEQMQKKAAPTTESPQSAAQPSTTTDPTTAASVAPSTSQPPPPPPAQIPPIVIPPEIQSIIPTWGPPPAATTTPPESAMLAPAPTTTTTTQPSTTTPDKTQGEPTQPSDNRDLAPPADRRSGEK